MERETEHGGSGDPMPTATGYLEKVTQEIQASIVSLTPRDQELHRGQAITAAFRLIRIVTADELLGIGQQLKRSVGEHLETFPVVKGIYMAIRDAFCFEKDINAVDCRRQMGLPIRGVLFPALKKPPQG